MKKILRSTAMMAASVASLLPLPHAVAAPSKQKKQRTVTQPPRARTAAASGDTGRDGPRKATPSAPRAGLTAPAASAITFTPSFIAAPTAASTVSEGRYPWKREIVTTTFWIGEKPAKNNPVPNHASSWDADWARHYGGTDTPDKDDRADYRPASFVPGQNPFYVEALLREWDYQLILKPSPVKRILLYQKGIEWKVVDTTKINIEQN